MARAQSTLAQADESSSAGRKQNSWAAWASPRQVSVSLARGAGWLWSWGVVPQLLEEIFMGSLGLL